MLLTIIMQERGLGLLAIASGNLGGHISIAHMQFPIPIFVHFVQPRKAEPEIGSGIDELRRT